MLVRLARDQGRRGWLLRRMSVMAAPVFLVAVPVLWHYREVLTNYYLVGNADATANLPMRDSARHYLYVAWQIGPALCVVMAGSCLWQVLRGWRDRKWSVRALATALDWKVLWIGLAPAGMLMVHGAGHNPFVSMPSVFGLLLFAFLPFTGRGGYSRKWGVGLSAALMGVVLWNAAGAVWRIQTARGRAPAMAAVRGVIERMRDDAAQRGDKVVRFSSSFSGYTLIWAVHNSMLYEYGGKLAGIDVVDPRGLRFQMSELSRFGPETEREWEAAVPGAGDDQKMAFLMTTAREKLDYLILPNGATAARYETGGPRGAYINRKVRRLREEILASGRWERLGPPLEVGPNEWVELYANRRALSR
jgi:hypothetical protein